MWRHMLSAGSAAVLALPLGRPCGDRALTPPPRSICTKLCAFVHRGRGVWLDSAGLYDCPHHLEACGLNTRHKIMKWCSKVTASWAFLWRSHLWEGGAKRKHRFVIPGPFLDGLGGHHMILPCPGTSTAHAGESESFLSSSPSVCVLKKSLFSFSSDVDEVYMPLEIYGTSIWTSVLWPKESIVGIFYRYIFFYHCIHTSDLYPWKIVVHSKI